MTEQQKRRIEDHLPGQPLQWDEESANDEIVALHRQLAAEKLRADQGWERAEAKSKECIELREVLAQAGVRAEPDNWNDFIKGCGYEEVAPGSFRKPAAPTIPAQVPAAEVRAAYEQAAQLMESKDDGIWANTCGAAIRSLAQSSTADKASEVRAAVQKLFNAVRSGAAPFKVEYALDQLEDDGAQVGIDAGYLRDIFISTGLIAAPSTADSSNTSALGEGVDE